MPSNSIPDYKEKQQILYISPKPPRDLIATGDRLLGAGRISDALEFYQKAQHAEGLENVGRIATESGDVMTFQQAMRALNRTVTAADWEKVGQRAQSLGKKQFAIRAFEKSENKDMLRHLQQEIGTKENGTTP